MTLNGFLPRKHYHRAPVHISTLKKISFLDHNYIGLHVQVVRLLYLHVQWPLMMGLLFLFLFFLGGTGLNSGWVGPSVYILWLQTKQCKAFPSAQFPGYFWEIRP